MHIISLSLDSSLANPQSVAAGRVSYAAAPVDRYDIILPASSTETVTLAPTVTCYQVTGRKWVQLWRMYRTAVSLHAAQPVTGIVTQDMYFLGFLGVLLARRFSVGCEVQVHGLEKYTWLRRQLARYVLRRATVVRVVSQRLAVHLQEEYAVPAASLVVLPVWVDTAAVTTGEQDTQLIEQYTDRCNLLSVGRLLPVKNVSIQILALSELLATNPKLHLHIVGDGPERPQLEQLVETHNLSQHVTFHGWQTDVTLRTLYALADIFLLTSHSEGWGMVAIEALATGTPVVMSDVGCAGDLIKHEQHGLIVPVADQAAVRDAVARLVTDTALREQLGTAGQQLVAALPDRATVRDRQVVGWQRL